MYTYRYTDHVVRTDVSRSHRVTLHANVVREHDTSAVAYRQRHE